MTRASERPSLAANDGPHAPQPESLGAITTDWSLVRRAHQGAADEEPPELNELLMRYYGAALRCLKKYLPRRPDVAEDLAQEFALKLKRGKFREARPEKGRFRLFLKQALRNLVADYYRQKKKQPEQLLAGMHDGFEQAFREEWRTELLDHAWSALQQVEQQRGVPYWTVLRWRGEHPRERLSVLARLLNEQTGKTFSAERVRKMLERARNRFADLLWNEVARSIEVSPTAPEHQDQVRDELAEFGLLKLYQRRGGA